MEVDLTEANDTVVLQFVNPVACPLRVSISHPIESVNQSIGDQKAIVLDSYDSAEVIMFIQDWEEEWRSDFSISMTMGRLNGFVADSSAIYELPFPQGYRTKIIQGYNGSFSHQTDFSRYAVDFGLQPGDTVCAARDGVVVGVIEGYDVGGKNRKYRPFANYLSLYHEDGVVTQYVHLQHEGILVSLGDSVQAGQPVGLAGMTGFTSVPHLHFNVLKPVEGTMISMPVNFSTGKGSELEQNQLVAHPNP